MTYYQVNVLIDNGKIRKFKELQEARAMAMRYMRKGFSVSVKTIVVEEQ